MSLLWPHKYQPKTLEELTLHPGLTENLKRLCSQEEFPHLLIYGPSGAGKKTRVQCILAELFGPKVHKIKIEAQKLTVNSKTIETTVVSSNFHSELNPSNSGNQDRVVIQEFLKTMAQSAQIDRKARHRFKVVVLDGADRLTRDAQAALRRTMEVYSGNLRLIMLAESTSSIIAPIKSRTLLVRVPAASEAEIVELMKDVSSREGADYSPEVLQAVGRQSGRNARMALAQLQAMNLQNKTTVIKPDWQVVIDGIADSIVKEQTVQRVHKARTDFYALLSHCVPGTVILKNLLFALLQRVSNADKVTKIIEAAAVADHRLHLGSKEIFHLESFVTHVMDIIMRN